VKTIASDLYSNLGIHIEERLSERESEYQEICYGVSQGWRSLEVVAKEAGSSDLEEWAEQLLELDLDYQFERFSKYLAEGTLDAVTRVFRNLTKAA